MPGRSDYHEPTDGSADDEDTLSRTDSRRARVEIEESMARLARSLIELGNARLEQLGLPEAVLDSVLDARSIRSAPALNRQLRLVRSALRDNDWSRIRARLDALLKHGVIPAALADPEPTPAARAPEWVARLLGEGNAAIEALLVECPSADRTHLRTLVRQVKKADAERRAKAEQRLSATVQNLLRRA